MEKYKAPPIPIYTNRATVRDIEKRFDYFFHHCKEGGGHAKVELTEASKAFETCGITVTPIPMMHGSLLSVGKPIKKPKIAVMIPATITLINSGQPRFCDKRMVE